jgi:hypothetical protein
MRKQDERKALTSMVERSPIKDKVIVIADRNYESYNCFAHIEQKGWNYLIRVKDVDTCKSIVSGLYLPSDGEFDVCIKRILTCKQTNEIKDNPELYRFIPHSKTFDFINKTNKFYPMNFRVVRFKITDDSYETIITNLEQSDFSADEIKKLYGMRWGIETSFRELKYAVGLNAFHSKKREYIEQEVFARIIMYNFAEMITSHVAISQDDAKHVYQINFTVAIQICRYFLRLWNNAPPPDVEALIRKSILPVRPNRSFKRNVRKKTAASFTYRIA